MDRLVLFDIDCTLIDSHGAGNRAMMRAIKEVYGVEGELGAYSFHGRTDTSIVRDLAELWGAGAPHDIVDALVGQCVERYVELFADEVAKAHIEVLPGVTDLVTALTADRRVLVGLLTGNVAEGARIKLTPTRLYPLFKVAAYGSDSALRSDLPAVAVARAEKLAGRRFAGKEIAVIGDTPADIGCGAELGVKTIAVATGRHSLDELAAHRPDFLFADMSDWRAVFEAILA